MSKVKPSPLLPETVIGGYRVVRRLSAGGFGVVYLARRPQRPAGRHQGISAVLARHARHRRTAPQVPPEKLSLYRLGLKSFFEEGRSLAQISHASVVSVLNFFRENETVYMVMNYLEGATLQDFIVTARDLKKQKVFRESTIRSLFDEILRGLRIVHQHKMLHLDIKPANIFVTDDDRAVMIDFGAAREVLSKEGNFIRPMYTPGFAAPEMYRRDSSMGPWTDIYAIGACIYACMQGYPPNDAPQRIEKDRLGLSLSRLRGIYSDNLIEVVEWCMSLDPLSRPQSVFALQKELSREGERRYTKLIGQREGAPVDRQHPLARQKQPAQGGGAYHEASMIAHAHLFGPFSPFARGVAACGQPGGAGMKFSVFQVSRKGGRLKNEDRMGYCYTRESGLFVLADGMGGHPEGEVAAQLALQTIAALYQREARPMLKDVKAFLGSRRDGGAPAGHALRGQQGHARHAAHHGGGGGAAGQHSDLGALRRFAPVRGARRRAAHPHARPFACRASAHRRGA